MTTTETNHPDKIQGNTQNGRILEYMEAHPNEWVPMCELGRIMNGWAVHSRVADLRKRGHNIENRQFKSKVDGISVTQSFYRLNK